jgi:hypothetical protein
MNNRHADGGMLEDAAKPLLADLKGIGRVELSRGHCGHQEAFSGQNGQEKLALPQAVVVAGADKWPHITGAVPYGYSPDQQGR